MTSRTKLSLQPYELYMFSRKHQLPLLVAREILDKYQTDRVRSDAIAERINKCRVQRSAMAVNGDD